MPTMQERFVALFPGRPLSKVEAAFERISDHYGEPGRHYHTLKHVQDMLEACEVYFPLAPREVLLAIWFHDVIYNTRSPHNEACSADVAFSMLIELDETLETASRVAKLILTTVLHVPFDKASAILCDLDLLSLAINLEEFRNNTRLIYEEYSWASSEQWTQGRKAFMERFLTRPHIYFTDVMRAKFEAVARFNLESSAMYMLLPHELPQDSKRLLDCLPD